MKIEPTLDKTEIGNILLRVDLIPNFPNYRVYKHNDLVECKSDFSAMEHRIILLALVQITMHDEKLKMYRINIKDVLGKKLHRSNYHLVRNAVRKLHKSTIEMEEKKGWKSYAFIIKAQGEYGANYIEIQFHQDIQKFLLGLKSQYTSYTLRNVMNFKKNYSLRIYELCKQYQKIGNRVMKLNYLKTLLSLDDKYSEFFNFKNNVLNPALKEINKYSDIEVTFKETREGRKVESINFSMSRKCDVSEKESKTLAEVGMDIENKRKLLSLGFKKAGYYKLRKKYASENINDILLLFEKNIDSIQFPKTWIENSLGVDYGKSTESMENYASKEENPKTKKEKATVMKSKKIEINALKEGIHYMEIDIKTQESTAYLNPGDGMQSAQDLITKKAIKKLRARIQENTVLIEKKQKDLEILEK